MQEQKYSIKQWAKDDRPREKLLSKGASVLSNSELLAILIGHGTRDRSAVELGQEILRAGRDNLNELGKLSVKDLMKIKGIGEAKAISIVAAMELGRRRQALSPLEKPVVKNSTDVATYFQALLKDHRHEVFAVLFLNRANKINHHQVISQGGITGTVADPRLIIRTALEHDAVNMILCHNHPSGSLRPSQNDLALTEKIKQAARLFDIQVLDHIIVSDEGYFSFSDDGIL